MACSSMPERDRKGQGENSLKQASRASLLTGVDLHTIIIMMRTCIILRAFLRVDAIMPFSGVAFFRVFCFHFLYYAFFAFIESAALRSIVFDLHVMRHYSHAHLANNNRMCPLLILFWTYFLLIWRCRFPSGWRFLHWGYTG